MKFIWASVVLCALLHHGEANGPPPLKWGTISNNIVCSVRAWAPPGGGGVVVNATATCQWTVLTITGVVCTDHQTNGRVIGEIIRGSLGATTITVRLSSDVGTSINSRCVFFGPQVKGDPRVQQWGTQSKNVLCRKDAVVKAKRGEKVSGRVTCSSKLRITGVVCTNHAKNARVENLIVAGRLNTTTITIQTHSDVGRGIRTRCYFFGPNPGRSVLASHSQIQTWGRASNNVLCQKNAEASPKAGEVVISTLTCSSKLLIIGVTCVNTQSNARVDNYIVRGTLNSNAITIQIRSGKGTPIRSRCWFYGPDPRKLH